MTKGFNIKTIKSHFGEENRSLFFWAAVLYGVGIGFYFLLPVEPPIWPPLVLAGLLWFFLGWFRNHNVFRLMFKGVLMVTLGFAAGTIRTAMVDTKTLGFETKADSA